MDILGPVQTFVLLVLAIGAFVLTGFAAVDALRRRGTLFPQVGRLTKPVWLGILVVAFLISILSLPGGYLSALSFLNVIGVVAAGVYLAEIRPKLRQIDGGGNTGYGRY